MSTIMNAPSVTPDDIKANIVHTEIVKHIAPSGQVLRWAVLTTKSGFAVAGRPSCAVSSENDDPKRGEEIAITNATQELWPLMGYALKERLAAVDTRPPAALYDEIKAEAIKAGETDPATLHFLAMIPFTNDLRGIVPKPNFKPAPVTNDFPLGKACDLTGEGNCEACQ